MVLFDLYASLGVEVLIWIFDIVFFREKMKISRQYFDHNFSCSASASINTPILEI